MLNRMFFVFFNLILLQSCINEPKDCLDVLYEETLIDIKKENIYCSHTELLSGLLNLKSAYLGLSELDSNAKPLKLLAHLDSNNFGNKLSTCLNTISSVDLENKSYEDSLFLMLFNLYYLPTPSMDKELIVEDFLFINKSHDSIRVNDSMRKLP